MKKQQLDINKNQYLEIEKLAMGVFAPLKKFMCHDTLTSCVEKMRLPTGEPFPIPVVFDIKTEDVEKYQDSKIIELIYEGEHVADLIPEKFYQPDKSKICEHVFGTTSDEHPGVKHYQSIGECFVSGEVILHKRPDFDFSKYEMTPEESRNHFKKMGWKTIVGFQTRNIPHRAHEYLQKTALEHVDGIMIQPLIGKKKSGDFNTQAVLAGYNALISNYYPQDRAILSVLSTVMRYAGPREAVFHAIIRRNYGCTHFIVGRDHAGVGNYYEKYGAHKLVKKFESELGIKVMCLHGPYYCEKCDQLVTEKTCPHKETSPESCFEISGTFVRDNIKNNSPLSEKYLRKEVIEALSNFNPFIE